jgi:hypothetical protein
MTDNHVVAPTVSATELGCRRHEVEGRAIRPRACSATAGARMHLASDIARRSHAGRVVPGLSAHA